MDYKELTMKSKLLLCLALVLSGGLFGCSTNAPYSDQTALATSSNSKPSFESVQRMFEQKDWKSLEKVDVKTIENFNLKQRNAIVVLAAKEFAGNDESTNGEFLDYTAINQATGMPNSLPAGMKWVSFEILDALDMNQAITTPDVIPYFIQNLENNDYDTVVYSLEFLISLTGRQTGFQIDYIKYDNNSLSKNQKVIADWWRNWWRENKDKHPVFDMDLKKILCREVLKIDKQIIRVSPPDTWPDDSAEKIRGNDWQGNWPRVDDNTVFTFWYDDIPGSGTGFIDPVRGDNSLCIRGDFLTKILQFGTSEVSSATSPDQNIPMKEIFHETVKGTGIEIKVEILTTNTALINILRDKLNMIKP
jgi:hypothetical protein